MACVVVARLKAKKGEEDRIRKVLGEISVQTRREQGNISFEVQVSEDDSSLFLVYEKYNKREDHDFHKNTQHYRELIVDYAAQYFESRDVEFFHSI